MVRQLVCIAGAGCIILILRAGLTGRVEELHEFSKAVRNLAGEKSYTHSKLGALSIGAQFENLLFIPQSKVMRTVNSFVYFLISHPFSFCQVPCSSRA